HLEGTTGRDPAILVLLQDIIDAVEERVAAEPDNVGEVLRAFRADLQDDLSLVEATLRRYNSVLATTVQQVDSSEMHRIVDAPLPVFDTVIVDEAARANPLDLMIPLACARKRIVLVGDHKQLPHALELKLERELRRTNRISTSSDLSRSLFERWFDMFDGIEPRLRT
ncbi:AAA domain-containing protein, partial [Micromonospora harpali]